MNKKMPLISIAMATYNGERFLTQQLESILSQTYENIELIICDDGSIDSTIDVIKQYAQENSMIRLYQNDERLGFVKNFEKAIGLCRGEYIVLSDQDDIWEHDKIEKQLATMQKEELKFPHMPIMVHSDLVMINEDDGRVSDSYFNYKKYTLKATKDLGHILGPCGVMGNTILFNRYVKDKILPFPEMIEFHDYWIAVVTELFGRRVTMSEKLVKYRIHQCNTSNTDKKLSNLRASFKLFRSFIRGEIIPPFLESKRGEIIRYILESKDIRESDKKVLLNFLVYLDGEESKIKHIYTLVRYSLLKRDWLYRMAVAVNYMLYDRRKHFRK